MRIALIGATGLIGRPLVRALADRGHDCLVISRGTGDPWRCRGVRVVRGDPTVSGPWQRELDGVATAINLAGARIVDPLKRWTDARKRELVESRVLTTRRIVEAMRAAAAPPRTLVNASAVGYYGSRGDQPVDERDGAGSGFLAELAVAWEDAAAAANDLARVILLRGGLVLSRDGGLLGPLLPLFRAGLGGPWGTGNQWLSWIHHADQTGLVLHALDGELAGPLNVTAPCPVTVSEFAAAFGRALRRPALLKAPSIALRVALGEAAQALLDSQRVIPRRALDSGYKFQFAELEQALSELF